MTKYWFDASGILPRPKSKEGRIVWIAFIGSIVFALIISLFILKNLLLSFLFLSNVILIASFGFILLVRAKSAEHPTEIVIGDKPKEPDDNTDEVLKL